jgi:hypothetical protein
MDQNPGAILDSPKEEKSKSGTTSRGWLVSKNEETMITLLKTMVTQQKALIEEQKEQKEQLHKLGHIIDEFKCSLDVLKGSVHWLDEKIDILAFISQQKDVDHWQLIEDYLLQAEETSLKDNAKEYYKFQGRLSTVGRELEERKQKK